MTVAVDTSVIVAGLLSWHEAHDAARRLLDDALGRSDLVVPAPALVEAYAVMTRLPAPHRLSPDAAHALLHANLGTVRVVALAGKDCWRLLDDARRIAVAGGRTYDAQIVACAVKARAGRLLTLNARDFDALVTGDTNLDLEIVAG